MSLSEIFPNALYKDQPLMSNNKLDNKLILFFFVKSSFLMSINKNSTLNNIVFINFFITDFVEKIPSIFLVSDHPVSGG